MKILVKFTKDEKTRLTFQMKQNVEHIKKQMSKAVGSLKNG